MIADQDDFIVFSDDSVARKPATGDAGKKSLQRKPWRILIVDDDGDVHNATEFALSGLDILDRPLQFLHAYSSVEAIDLLMVEADVAVILLDVVMENEDAGLSAVSTIRTDLGLTNTQIILRTGQPGYAPELETIRRYDINDYRTKSELSRVKLYTALTASVRAYEQLCRLDSARKGSQQVVGMTSSMLAAKDTPDIFSTILTHAQSLVDIAGDALLCEQESTRPDELRVLAATGVFSGHLNECLPRELHYREINVRARVDQSFSEARTLIDPDAYVLKFSGGSGRTYALFLPNTSHKPPVTRQLIDVFCSNAEVCAENLRLMGDLKAIAFHDPLTGLGSRRAFIAELDHRLATQPRDQIALVLLDLDQFAETNDMFGHQYGDQLLQAIALRLREEMPPQVFVARLGADQFALLGTPVRLEMDGLRKRLATAFIFDGEERMVSIASSFVLAADADPGADGNALLKDASIVIKRAKSQGLGRHINYTPAFRSHTREHTRTLHELGAAFRKRQLHLVYQPQVSLPDGQVTGVEALLRWRDADGQFIPPDRFIPIAENSGLILPIGQWVLTTAVEALLALKQAGHSGIRMAVNVSPPQLSTPAFLQHLDDLLANYPEAAQGLELEVTESVSVLGFDEVFAQLTAIRSRGVTLAIDDFGTGYSSLSYLDKLPADLLKIDRAFVSALDPRANGPRIAEMVISLGRQLNMKVLAEGVETETQAKLLLDMGCDEAQGYLFGRPMPYEDLLPWLNRRR